MLEADQLTSNLTALLQDAPPSAATVFTLALEGLLLPGGLLFGKQLLGSYVPPHDSSFWPATTAVALSLSGPTSRAAAMEPVMAVDGDCISLDAALEVVKLVRYSRAPLSDAHLHDGMEYVHLQSRVANGMHA